MSLDLVVMEAEKFRELVRDEIRAAFAELNHAGVEKPVKYAQAAKFAECSVTTVQAWVKSGALPATGKGKLRRVLLSDVSKVLAGMRATPAAVQTKARSRAEEILSNVRRIR